jgi:hypothetical protein
VNLLNVGIGAVGKRVRWRDTARGRAATCRLTQAMYKGEIEAHPGDVNPVYTMPPKPGFAEGLAKCRWW